MRHDDPVQPASTAATDDLVARVVAWYDERARDLPWRAPDRTPWGVLASEVMLQQTPVARVEPAWRAWMARWPTPADLAAASPADVLRAWDRLGYPRRALRLQECARALVDRHAGVVPDDEEALLALPGVGAYTAAAVRAFAFGRRAVVLDTNVRRVLARATLGRALPAPAQTRAEVAHADAVAPRDDARLGAAGRREGAGARPRRRRGVARPRPARALRRLAGRGRARRPGGAGRRAELRAAPLTGAGAGSGTGAAQSSSMSIRVLPSVFGFTRARSRNSATPSSCDRSSSR
jgi:endonuclease III